VFGLVVPWMNTRSSHSPVDSALFHSNGNFARKSSIPVNSQKSPAIAR